MGPSHKFQQVKASQDIGCFYLLFITFYLMGRAGIIMEKKGMGK
jgi:hypothetical protein